MKKKNRIQLLLKKLSKPDQVKDDIVQPKMQVFSSEVKQNTDASLNTPHNPESATYEELDYREMLIEQLRKSDI